MPLDAMLDVSNEALLVAYGNGDRHAARDLTIRLTPVAFRLASRLLQDTAEAEDVARRHAADEHERAQGAGVVATRAVGGEAVVEGGPRVPRIWQGLDQLLGVVREEGQPRHACLELVEPRA